MAGRGSEELPSPGVEVDSFAAAYRAANGCLLRAFSGAR